MLTDPAQRVRLQDDGSGSGSDEDSGSEAGGDASRGVAPQRAAKKVRMSLKVVMPCSLPRDDSEERDGPGSEHPAMLHCVHGLRRRPGRPAGVSYNYLHAVNARQRAVLQHLSQAAAAMAVGVGSFSKPSNLQELRRMNILVLTRLNSDSEQPQLYFPGCGGDGGRRRQLQRPGRTAGAKPLPGAHAVHGQRQVPGRK